MEKNKVKELVEYLEGTCNSLEDATDNLEIDYCQACEALEQEELQLCETCGWWNKTDEMEIVDDEYTCHECLAQ